VPPRWLLDLAQANDLRVLVGLPWEQHVTFLDEASRVRRIEQTVREGVRACVGHPAVLGYAVGNEIPAPIVRWYGKRRIERFLNRLYNIVKKEDRNSLVTYVNFPTTEYLDLRFLDFCCFNVYLETPETLKKYLARLQNLAGNQPLVLAEIGLDSRRNGPEQQAESLQWQLRMAYAEGCAGTFVFAWTDEWHRGGFEVDDWDFGLTTRDREPKPALPTVSRVYSEVPFPEGRQWPSISVVVCTHNGARTLEECLSHATQVDYPNYEVIVVDDGSTDSSAEIAERTGVRLIRVKNGGLSSARNIGWQQASGEVVAYLDDDAYPDRDWLTYLANTFLETDFVGVGGPNIPPAGDGMVADAVGYAPGGPSHVLLDDTVAEHIPGCNMAFRRAHLEAIGGFDARFRVAGDDVDICWRLQDRGWKLGFSPAAVVWHHRRASVGAYWRQQKGYGKAEALLERKWPQKYNVIGHPSWQGRVYGTDASPGFSCVSRIYHGIWGTAPFQSIYQSCPGLLRAFPLMPEWILVTGCLGLVGLLRVSWPPLLAFALLFGLALITSGAYATRAAWSSVAAHPPIGKARKGVLVLVTMVLHFLQPVARLWGRLRHGITPWRIRGLPGLHIPRPSTRALWSEEWQGVEFRLGWMEQQLWATGAVVLRGSEYDRWDLEVRSGFLGAARLRMAVEEHGGGRQLWRLRVWPKVTRSGLMIFGVTALLAALAFQGAGWIAGTVLSVASIGFTIRKFRECMWAMNAVFQSFEEQRKYEKFQADDNIVSAVEPATERERERVPAMTETRSVAVGERAIG
jgi:GT2 family glycosyltransferase